MHLSHHVLFPHARLMAPFNPVEPLVTIFKRVLTVKVVLDYSVSVRRHNYLSSDSVVLRLHILFEEWCELNAAK